MALDNNKILPKLNGTSSANFLISQRKKNERKAWKKEKREEKKERLLRQIACVLSRFSCVWLFATTWTIAHLAPLSTGFLGRNTEVGCHCFPPWLVNIYITNCIRFYFRSEYSETCSIWIVNSDMKTFPSLLREVLPI